MTRRMNRIGPVMPSSEALQHHRYVTRKSTGRQPAAAAAVPYRTTGRAIKGLFWLITVSLIAVAAGLAHGAEPLPPIRAELQEVFDGRAPENLQELRWMQAHVQRLAEHVKACTVGIQIGPAHGSGVIISEDGYVMTVAHVASDKGLTARVILPNGERVAAKTLGLSWDRDASLLKITGDRKWPHLELGDASRVKAGQWCAAVGHPGGFDPERAPVFRLGRILGVGDFLRSDCQLVGGDSGGPLVDMSGRVIGIHSRIGNSLANNQHVPVSAYQESWDRLVQKEVWGLPTQPYIGVSRDLEVESARIAAVDPDSPAEKAGLKPGDVIVRFDDREVPRFRDLRRMVMRSKPGDSVKLEVQRGDRLVHLDLTIGDMLLQRR